MKSFFNGKLLLKKNFGGIHTNKAQLGYTPISRDKNMTTMAPLIKFINVHVAFIHKSISQKMWLN